MKLSVLDETETKPELIGDTVIQLKPAFESSPVDGYDEWHELTYKGKYAGEVYLEMTFYPARPPSSRRRKRSQRYSETASISSFADSTYGGGANYEASQLGYSSLISSFASSIRPLPEQPHNLSVGSQASASGSGQPASELSTSAIGSDSQYATSALEDAGPPMPPAHSVYGRDHGGIMNMSTMSRSLPSPFEYQEFRELQVIPPEHLSCSEDEDEDPMAFFTTPLPPGPAEDGYQEQESLSASVSRQSSSRSSHMYSPVKSSPLSQSTSYESLDYSEPVTPQHNDQHYYSFEQQLPPMPPSHRESQSGEPIEFRESVSSNGTVGFRESVNSTGSTVRRKPITRKSVSPSTQFSASTASAISPESSAYAPEIPFSADSYVPSGSINGRSPYQQQPQQHQPRKNSRRKSEMPISHHHRRDEFSESKPLPRAPMMASPNTADYLGEGQWDLSDEINAGYSDDLYGFIGAGAGNHNSNMLPKPQRTRSRHDRMSLPVNLETQKRSNRIYSGATIRGTDDCLGDYYYSEEDDGIRYVN